MHTTSILGRGRLLYVTSLLALGSFLGLEHALADQPDAKAKPTFGSATLKSGFRPDPFTRKLTAGGQIETNLGGVKANLARAPDFRLHYTAGDYPLRIYVASKGDTTLLVNLPNGAWVANDDGGVGNNPQLSFAKPQSGQYDIWVGTFEGKNVEAALHVSEMSATPSGMGIRVDVEALGKRANLYNNPRLFNELDEEWNTRKDKINAELENLLGSLNKHTPKGVNFVRQKSAVGTAVVKTNLGKVTGGFSTVKLIEISLDIKGNSMRTRITQPTILGSDADPEFLVTYDIRGKAFIPVADDGKRLAVSKVTLESYNVRIDPRNTTARLATWFDTAWFDSHFKHLGEQLLTKKLDLAPKVNKLLEPINAKLATVPGQVTTRIEPGFNIVLIPRLPDKKGDIVVK